MAKETHLKTSLCLLCLFVAILLGCTKPPSSFTQVQQQRSGDYVLTLFSDSGSVKQHSNKFKLEIRNAASNEPANVSNVQIQSSMRMPGMGPMFGNISSIQQTGPGQYELDADFSMAGQWSFVVTFEPNGRAQFNLNAQ